ncbi:polymer-forming cytoskeletal protein [Maribacter sp. CXY002]|uniref:polymer-forming cytoskeletal protein n=1 Tax=Maribacter luteocoastalis TaxID=3407671 RepID=UPI003B675D92
MKAHLLYFCLLLSIVSFAQQKDKTNVTLTDRQDDDTYLAGENVRSEAPINGDMVIAGGNVSVRDTVYQDLLVAGGEIIITGYVSDDIRAAGGTLTIDTEVGDDVIIAGGEVYITDNTVINGNLINFSGDIRMNGTVKGMVKSYAGNIEINGNINKETELYGEDITINGIINGSSKIVGEDIHIGETAKFYDDVTYWSNNGEVDFGNSLINASATLDKSLMAERDDFTWKGFGVLAFGVWVFYLFSALLALLLLNWAFQHFFATAASNLNTQFFKSLGYGLIYIFGIPIVIIITFLMIIGIPVGLFLGSIYIFSLLFGHLVTSLLLSHYLAQTPGKKWGYWKISLFALLIAAGIRLLTFIPFLGALITISVIALGYGLVAYTLFKGKLIRKVKVT